MWATQRSGGEEVEVAGTEGSNAPGLLECWGTWGWRRGERELSTEALPSPPRDQRQGGSFAYENEVLAPALDRPRFQAPSHLHSSKRLGATTLLPLGTFMLPEPRESQNWVALCFHLPHPSHSYKWSGGRCPQPRELGWGARFVAERKGEAWTMSQSPLPSSPPTHRKIPLPELAGAGEFSSRAEQTEAFPWELECVSGHRAADGKHRELTPACEVSVHPSVVSLRRGTRFYPPPYIRFLVEAGRDTPHLQPDSRLCPLLCIYISPLGDRQMGQWTEPQTEP